MPDTPHEDQPLVRAMRNRSTDALTLVYDRYGPQLFDYCHAILRDEPYAARVVHDTLLAAEAHITQLPAPDKLRGWLYALARRECQRILRGPDRPTKRRPAPEAPDEFGTPQDRQRHHDARMLAHNALSALTGRQREAVDLTVRHGLTDTELAGVLAIPLEEAAALAEGSRDDLAEAVSGLVGHQRVQLSRLLAVMPIAMAPPNLESRILASALDPEMNAERAAIARRAMPFDSRGWPVESDQRQGHRAPADPDRTLVDRPSDDDERDGIPAFVWPTVGAAAVAALVAGLFLFDLSSDDGPSRDSTVVAASPSTSEDDEEVLDEEPSERPTKTKKPTQKPTEDPETPTSTPTPQPSTSSPTPTPKPTPTQVEPGQLVVGAGCTIGAQATQCSVPIAAKGGPVRWSAQGYGPISGGGSGLLKAGATRLVTFTVARADECVEGQIVINFTPAGSTTVAWMCPPVEPDPGDDGDDEPDPAAP
ncbi:sigma-70 family RNA polymerase sigma factor [Actinocorallia sp. A-T 12471]|uniref:RNA polymerase sigma factor n=1 Tax=Actinocorallia sp. A-T 12471 TaxID=3089813 RepID=UPI0029D38162|nr:sigma-70 family RNA polymerase sigma factor [Actinocorallia sp. A-T 12471]MDX6742847.1 sigma-70 family RNA polymerase sigma factor [Actinocorallia sp. A-T 12471]